MKLRGTAGKLQNCKQKTGGQTEGELKDQISEGEEEEDEQEKEPDTRGRKAI